MQSLEQDKSEVSAQLIETESAKSSEINELTLTIEKLQENLEKLSDDSSQLQEEKTRLTSEFETVSRNKSEIEESYQEALAKIEKLEVIGKEKLELEEVIAECKIQNESLAQQIEEKKLECESLEEKLNDQQVSSSGELESLKDESSAEITDLTLKVASLEGNLEKLQEGSSRLIEEKVQLENEHKEILKAKSEVDEKYEMCLANIARLEEVEREKLKLEDANVELKAANDCLLHDFDQKKSEYGELEAKLEAENEKASQELEALTLAKDDEIRDLALNLESCEANVDKLREEYLLLSEQKALLENEHEETLKIKSQVEESYQGALASIERLEAIEKEKIELDAVNADMKASNELLSKEVEQKTSECETLEAKMTEQQETSSKEIETLNHHIRENEEKIEVLTTCYNFHIIISFLTSSPLHQSIYQHVNCKILLNRPFYNFSK